VVYGIRLLRLYFIVQPFLLLVKASRVKCDIALVVKDLILVIKLIRPDLKDLNQVFIRSQKGI